MTQSLASGTRAHADLVGERNRKTSANRRDIAKSFPRGFPKCAHPRERKRAEKILTAWTRRYSAWFPNSSSPDQLDRLVDLNHFVAESGQISTTSHAKDGKTSHAFAAVH